jgi:hypothetical protein
VAHSHYTAKNDGINHGEECGSGRDLISGTTPQFGGAEENHTEIRLEESV